MKIAKLPLAKLMRLGEDSNPILSWKFSPATCSGYVSRLGEPTGSASNSSFFPTQVIGLDI